MLAIEAACERRRSGWTVHELLDCAASYVPYLLGRAEPLED